MAVLRILLFPFSIIYGLVTGFRNQLFDWGILPSKQFRHPVIGVGNLSVGGTGKTPMIEYLVKFLKNDYGLAVLSRGYGRKSSGFMIAGTETGAIEIGDEPMQVHIKHPDILVAVCEKRVAGIENILKEDKNNQVILLDDAFQHRYVKPGLNILLSDYHNLFTRSHLMPTGDLREFRRGAIRADVLVVTKTPCVFSPLDRKIITEELAPYNIPDVFFTFIRYGKLVPITKPAREMTEVKSRIIYLLTGIANPIPLAEHLKRMCTNLHLYRFPDHHEFSVREIREVLDKYLYEFSSSKIIVTTEKDSMRLQKPELAKMIQNVPIFYIPIEVEFHKEDKKRFNNLVMNYIEKERGDNSTISPLF